MTQQVPPPSKLRKGFIFIGLALLISGFIFFYWASRVNFDYVSTHNDTVNLVSPSYAYNYSQFGYPQWGFEYQYYVRNFVVQPSDVIEVSYPNSPPINGTLHITIWQEYPTTTADKAILSASDGYSLFQDWTNNEPLGSGSLTVQVLLVAQNIQNVTVSTTTEVHHYETPQWVYFGVGVVLSSLAVIPIFKSKK